MRRKKISEIIQKQVNSIQSACLKMSKGFDMKAIHSFRIEVKKLKSFLQLINTGRNGKSKIRISGRLKIIYETAGTIRNLQLQKSHLNESLTSGGFDHPKTYFGMIQTELSELKQKAGSLVNRKKLFKKEKKSLIMDAPHQLGKKQYKQFVESKGRQLAELFSRDDINDKNLHVVRKVLKNFLDDFSYIKKDILKTFPFGFLDSDRFSGIIKVIGAYHDSYTALGMLDEQLELHVFFEKEKSLLLDIRADWLQKKGVIKNKLKGELEKVNIPGYRNIVFAGSTRPLVMRTI
jgi:CHAD domain-containing protein